MNYKWHIPQQDGSFIDSPLLAIDTPPDAIFTIRSPHPTNTMLSGRGFHVTPRGVVLGSAFKHFIKQSHDYRSDPS